VFALVQTRSVVPREGRVRSQGLRFWRVGICRGVLLCCAGFACAESLAGQSDYGAGLSLAHDTDVALGTEPEPRPDWTETVFMGLGYADSTSSLSTRVAAQVERRKFVRGTYKDDTAYFVNGSSVWTILPQRLTWTVEDVAADALVALTAPDIPVNRVQSNSLSTGPELTLRVTPTDTSVIGGKYGRFDIDGPGDNQRRMGYVRWLHQVSSLTKVSLNYEVTRVTMDPPAQFPDFLERDEFLRYEMTTLFTHLVFEGGVTRIRRYGEEDTSGRLVRATTTFALTSTAALRVVFADQISDTANDLLRGVLTANTITPPTAPFEAAASAPLAGSNVGAEDLYRSQRAEMTYVFQDGRLGYEVQAHTRRVNYVTLVQQDYHEGGGRLTLSWSPSIAMRIYGYIDSLQRTFPDPSVDEKDKERVASLGVSYRLTPNIFSSLEGSRRERDSNVAANYSDTRVVLSLGITTGAGYFPKSKR
jgi:hypothetical protein